MEIKLYDFVIERLDASNKTYQEIADGSGVPKRTVEKIARKETIDPGVNTVQKLADYFHSHRAAA